MEKLLAPPVKSTTFMKSHYDGLVIVFPKKIIVTKIENGKKPTACILHNVNLKSPILNLHDFQSSYRYIGWTPEGNILQIDLNDNDLRQG